MSKEEKGAALPSGKDFFAGLVDNLHEGVYFVDPDRVITYWNKAAERISGFSAAEVVGKSCRDDLLTHVDSEGNNLCLGMCPLAATIEDGQPREAEVYLHHKDGHRVPVSVRVTPLLDSAGTVIGGIELFSDISHRPAILMRMKELERKALVDELTGLANRRHVEDEIFRRMEEAKRYRSRFGLIFMDIDRFKHFNDTYGHQVGDRVLKFVANTLIANSRPFDLYGRWGGEEFVGVIRGVDLPELERVGERMRMLVESSYLMHNDCPLRVTISAGATLIREGDSRESLIRRADRMMYESKKNGRNRLTAG